jgi:hypothetical protein
MQVDLSQGHGCHVSLDWPGYSALELLRSICTGFDGAVPEKFLVLWIHSCQPINLNTAIFTPMKPKRLTSISWTMLCSCFEEEYLSQMAL